MRILLVFLFYGVWLRMKKNWERARALVTGKFSGNALVEWGIWKKRG